MKTIGAVSRAPAIGWETSPQPNRQVVTSTIAVVFTGVPSTWAGPVR